jgi:methanogenic corrinoid protein MtbC1
MDGLRQVLTWQESLCDPEGEEPLRQNLFDIGTAEARGRIEDWSRRLAEESRRGPQLDLDGYGVAGGRDSTDSAVPDAEAVVPSPTAEDVAKFARLILKRDTSDAFAFIEKLRARGVTAEVIYLDLLAPSARHLGDLWVADYCDFTEVTIGLGRLQQIMHELSYHFQRNATNLSHNRRVLLLPAPGEQHSFGLLMVSEFFRRSGWDVWSSPRSSDADVQELVQGQGFPLVGFSVSCERHLEDLARTISVVRKHSRNPDVAVMVGGPLVAGYPDMVSHVGADATATDARQAAARARKLLDRQA